MKKNIIIGILVIVALLSLAYGFVQNAAAVKVQEQALLLADEAKTQRALADANAKEAMLQTEKARVEAENARRIEAECAKKK